MLRDAHHFRFDELETSRVTDIQLCAKAHIPRHRHRHPRRHPREDPREDVGVVEYELYAMSRCIWSLLS